MEYLLFNWEEMPDVVGDLTTISNKDFREYATKYGVIYDNEEDFKSAFNAEKFNTVTHQLRILPKRKNRK